MSKLKLFVSHSSRLDDVDHQYTREDHNWALLEATCKAIREQYPEHIEVLVDRDGLIPGDDWNHRLNVWLAECHVALILFSRRAIEKSHWVAKEAAILSWRAELNDEFKLIPVLLDGETTPEDLARDFLGVLRIDRSQCIRNATGANDILAGLKQQLGDPRDWPVFPKTPLERLQDGIAEGLSGSTTDASLEQALHALGCPPPPAALPHRQHYANRLARCFLASGEQVNDWANTFMCGLDPLQPPPAQEWAEYVLRAVRPLWVDPGAAAYLPRARRERDPLALSGQYTTYADNYLAKEAYTVERYLERAWPGSNLYCLVMVTRFCSLDEFKRRIRACILGPALPPWMDGDAQDKEVIGDPRLIVLVISARADAGGLPDAALLDEMQQRLLNHYPNLVVLFAVDATDDPLPAAVKAIAPPLDPQREQAAFLAERRARTYLDQKYGINP